MADLREFKKVAFNAAQKAEERILYYFDNQPVIEIKTDKSPVTKADKEAEDELVMYWNPLYLKLAPEGKKSHLTYH